MYKTKAELDAALAEGKITQEEYNTLLAGLDEGGEPTPPPSKEDLMRELLKVKR